MKHPDAKAIRERLNTVTLAISALEDCPQHPEHQRIATAARAALRDIAALVTHDEREEQQTEHGDGARHRGRRVRDDTELRPAIKVPEGA